MNCFNERKLDYNEVEMILVGNHAPFTWGKNAAKAVYNSAVLEQVAHMALLTEQINGNAARLKDALIKNILSASTARIVITANRFITFGSGLFEQALSCGCVTTSAFR